MDLLTPKYIEVVGADANNLRDINIRFPLGGVSMIVGVSGSGKSSLLRNVLACEGNLRLHDFLGIGQTHLDLPMSRSFVGQLPATVHVGQRAFRASSRTTVGTASGLLSLLRQMFIRWSNPVSNVTNKIVPPPNVADYAQWLFAHHIGDIVIWSVPISFTVNDGMGMAKRLRLLGIETVTVRGETDTVRQWQKGRVVSLSNFKPLSRTTRHLVEVDIGRMKIGKQTKPAMNRLQDLLDLAFKAGEGKVFIELPGNRYSDLQGSEGPALDSRHHRVTPADPRIYRSPGTHLLTFNSPDHEASGACPECRGLGRTATIDLDILISNPHKSMHDGAFSLWAAKNYKYVNIAHHTIEGMRDMWGFDPDLPWQELGEDARRLILEGSGAELVVDLERGTFRKMSQPRKFPGFLTTIMKHFVKGTKTSERLAFLMNDGPCPTCQGSRWSHAARALELGGRSIDDILQMNFEELRTLCRPDSEFARALPTEAAPFLAQLSRLAESLVGVGLSHLSADRGMLAISEGESRRIRLAAVFDGRHEGLCLLLDEPARGLHDEDVVRLASTLDHLRGPHTLIINEHRQRLAGAADFFVELGPGAGPGGGTIVRAGPVPQQWWRRDREMARETRMVQVKGPHLKIRGARWNNLLDVAVDLPLGHLVCITGVSGSGKSSFVQGVLTPALVDPSSPGRRRWTKITGAENIDGVVSLGQRSPPANRRSTVATFLDVAKLLRSHYGKLPAASTVGLGAKDFGFNSGIGRCLQCLGIGETKDGEHWIQCASCGGVRFESLVLSVRDGGLNLAQLLDKAVLDLIASSLPVLKPIAELLKTIRNLGLGHLSLGRRLDTLSGGEVQRLRIARELSMNNPRGLVFLLDEPASGLHKADVASLLKALDHIVAQGKNTVILVEHNLEIIAASDWVIEFGPGSGPKGGRVVATGSPELIRTTDTATGRMLRLLGKPPDPMVKVPFLPADAAIRTDGDAAASTLRWLRRLLGDDIPPLAQTHGMERACPTVRFSPHQIAETRLIEYGGLDRELISLILELHQLSDHRYDPSVFIKCWQDHPSAEMVIHPLVHEMYIWGSKVPASLVKSRRKQLIAQGYQWFDHGTLSEIRVGGERFSCPADADLSRRQDILAAALAIGTGYVELRDGPHILACHTTRPMDLARGLIGPVAISPYDLQRTGQRGRCFACKGSGTVTVYDHQLLLREKDCAAEDKDFLHVEALRVLKGVHRNTLLPFLRRLTKEGLWNPGIPIRHLSKKQLDLILYGYWSRPGPGSFLKSSKSNPDEVSSWLCWDGLFSHIRENAARGSDEWRSQLLRSVKQSQCAICDGLGLQGYIELIRFGSRSYRQWIESGSVAGLCDTLQQLEPENPRIQHRRDRLLAVLSPLLQAGLGTTRLFGLLGSGPYEILIPLVVANFTRMPLLMDKTE